MRSVGIENTQTDRLKIPELPDCADIQLAGKFRHGVRRFRNRAHGFRQRLAFLIAVNSTGGAENHFPVADVMHGFQEGHSPADIRFLIIRCIQKGVRDDHFRRKVVDHIHILQQPPQGFFIVELAANELNLRTQAFRL